MRKRAWFVVGVILLALFATCHDSIASDFAALPVKAAPKGPADGWSGFYVGGHFGIAAGSADWQVNDFGAPLPSVRGSINLFNSFDAFRGTGSYFGGFQGGYNYVLSSGLLIGVESDVSFGN